MSGKIMFLRCLPILLLMMSSCYTRFYYNVRNPIPLFKNKGDIYLDASSKIGTNGEFTAGYALTNGLALYSGVSFTAKSTSSFYREYVHGNSFLTATNFGIGYFRNEAKNPLNRLEIFGEYSNGYLDISEYDTDDGGFQDYTGRYHKYSLLMNFSQTNWNGAYTRGYSIRVGDVQFYNTQANHPNYWDHYNHYLNTPNHLIIEQAYFGRIGRGNVKFQYQLGVNYSQKTGPISAFPSIVAGIVFSPNIFGRNRY